MIWYSKLWSWNALLIVYLINRCVPRHHLFFQKIYCQCDNWACIDYKLGMIIDMIYVEMPFWPFISSINDSQGTIFTFKKCIANVIIENSMMFPAQFSFFDRMMALGSRSSIDDIIGLNKKNKTYVNFFIK